MQILHSDGDEQTTLVLNVGEAYVLALALIRAADPEWSLSLLQPKKDSHDYIKAYGERDASTSGEVANG